MKKVGKLRGKVWLGKSWRKCGGIEINFGEQIYFLFFHIEKTFKWGTIFNRHNGLLADSLSTTISSPINPAPLSFSNPILGWANLRLWGNSDKIGSGFEYPVLLPHPLPDFANPLLRIHAYFLRNNRSGFDCLLRWPIVDNAPGLDGFQCPDRFLPD